MDDRPFLYGKAKQSDKTGKCEPRQIRVRTGSWVLPISTAPRSRNIKENIIMGSETRADFFPFFRILNDGSIQRFMGTDTLPPQNSGVPVASHDITLDATKAVYVRVYVPTTTCQLREKLPIVVYINGGGFYIQLAASPRFHKYLNLLATEARVICVSVDYRRVPEHRLSVLYEDCFSALQWLDSETPVPLIDAKTDFGRCLVAGDSAGGNVVHQLGIMASQKRWKRLCILGAALIHLFFDREDKIDVELGPESKTRFDLADRLWKLSLPDGVDKDHPFSNPIVPNSAVLSSLVYRLLVVVTGKDFLKHRGKLYYEALREAGKEAAFMIVKEEAHVVPSHGCSVPQCCVDDEAHF